MTPEALIIESMFRVVTKEGVDVDFVLNSAQRQIDENMTGRDIIPKARQEGVSTYFLARYTAACLRKRNVKATIISHEADATSRLLSRCTYFLDNLRGPDPVPVLSIAISPVRGTAWNKPERRLLALGQYAYSEQCRCVIVSPRPNLFDPAVPM